VSATAKKNQKNVRLGKERGKEEKRKKTKVRAKEKEASDLESGSSGP